MRPMRAELQQIRDWADTKLAAGEEPPWAWFQYMKLREVIDDTLAGMGVVDESASQTETATGTKLQVVSDSDKPIKVQLPI